MLPEDDWLIMVLDHIFVSCKRSAQTEIDQAQRAGFCADFGRTHEGHGTANRLVLFPHNYLEFIWIDDKAAASVDPMRFPERIEATDGYVFGIGLRIDHEKPDFLADWTRVQLSGLESGHLRVRPDCFDDLALPMVFALVLDDGPLPRPMDRDHAEELFSHSCGADGILSAELEGPGWGALSREGLPDEVLLREGPLSKIDIRLHGTRDAFCNGEKTLQVQKRSYLHLGHD